MHTTTTDQKAGKSVETANRATNLPAPRADGESVTLDSYARLALRPDWTESDIYRAIVCNLPRRLHGLDAQARRKVLKRAPPLTGTPWDALLAASAEHVARRHADPPEPWMDEPERFLDTPWFANAKLHFMRWEALCYAPAAFMRHGTPIHPSDLDARGGDEPWRDDA